MLKEGRNYRDRAVYNDYSFNRIRLFIETYKLLKAADSQVLSTLVLNVTLPSLVIVNLNSAELDFSFSILPIMMIVYGVLAKFTVLWLFNKHNNHIKVQLE